MHILQSINVRFAAGPVKAIRNWNSDSVPNVKEIMNSVRIIYSAISILHGMEETSSVS